MVLDCTLEQDNVVLGANRYAVMEDINRVSLDVISLIRENSGKIVDKFVIESAYLTIGEFVIIDLTKLSTIGLWHAKCSSEHT